MKTSCTTFFKHSIGPEVPCTNQIAFLDFRCVASLAMRPGCIIDRDLFVGTLLFRDDQKSEPVPKIHPQAWNTDAWNPILNPIPM